jgi:hypothetical protein
VSFKLYSSRFQSSSRKKHHLSAFVTKCQSRDFAYDDNEPEYDPEEPEEYTGENTTNGVDDLEAGKNPDQLLTTGDRDVVVSGDPSAVAARGKSAAAPKDKKIPNDKRTTTPYMTKYERARILGTRALQIRYVSLGRTVLFAGGY